MDNCDGRKSYICMAEAENILRMFEAKEWMQIALSEQNSFSDSQVIMCKLLDEVNPENEKNDLII